jgi:hypothetical protein
MVSLAGLEATDVVAFDVFGSPCRRRWEAMEQGGNGFRSLISVHSTFAVLRVTSTKPMPVRGGGQETVLTT